MTYPFLLDKRCYSPPYEKLPAYSATSPQGNRKVLSQVQTRDGSLSSAEISGIDIEELERFRYFLFYTLVIDYKAKIPYKVRLSAQDQEHFLYLGNAWNLLQEECQTVIPMEKEKKTLADFFWKHFHRPCRTSRLPKDLVLNAIVRFAEYRDSCGRYKGCIGGILHNHGLQKVAVKLFVDRTILIPAIAPGPKEAALLLQALAKMERCFFTSPVSFDAEFTFAPSTTTEAEMWTHGFFESHQLTPAAAAYQKRRSRTINGIDRTPSRSKIDACLRALRNRANHVRERLQKGKCRDTPGPELLMPAENDERTSLLAKWNPDFWTAMSAYEPSTS